MAIPVTDWGRPRNSGPMTAPPPDTKAWSFEALYEAHVDDVWRAVRRLGVEVGSVDDVVQDSFITAWRSLAGFEGRSSVKTWLVGIAFNHARHALRAQTQRRASSAPLDAQLPSPQRAPDDAVATQRQGQALLQLLEGLPVEQREVFVLMELEGLTAPEVSQLLEVPVNTVYSRLRLARAAINDAVARLEEPT